MLTVGLHADNEKKSLLENFCIAYKNILSRCHLIATEATAEHIHVATGLEVQKLLAGGLGGDKQLESALLEDEIDLMISFERVTLDSIGEISDHNTIIRLCDLCSIPIATNIATAECLILGLDRGDLNWRENK